MKIGGENDPKTLLEASKLLFGNCGSRNVKQKYYKAINENQKQKIINPRNIKNRQRKQHLPNTNEEDLEQFDAIAPLQKTENEAKPQNVVKFIYKDDCDDIVFQ